MTYYPKINGLRFIAIGLVLVEHFTLFDPGKFYPGYYGVDLFFSISGFLVTLVLLQTKDRFFLAYKKFIARRAIRIFPIYYLSIFILYLAGVPAIKTYLFFFLTYTFNYAWIYFHIPIGPTAHFWSLSVEEQFYIIWPFMALLLRNKQTLFAWITSLLIIVCICQKLFYFIPHLESHANIGLFPRGGSICAGALAAILFTNNKIPGFVKTSLYLELLIIALLVYSLFSNSIWKYPLMQVCSFFFLVKSASAGFRLNFINRLLSNKTITYIGLISYGIYIYHLPMSYYLTNFVYEPALEQLAVPASMKTWCAWGIKLPVYALLSIAIAHFSYRFIEKPVLALKDSYFKY
jgi:peptidoglycan/LPS O-acetylase OafA/YrhL